MALPGDAVHAGASLKITAPIAFPEPLSVGSILNALPRLLGKIRSLQENQAARLLTLAATLTDWIEPIACMGRTTTQLSPSQGSIVALQSCLGLARSLEPPHVPKEHRPEKSSLLQVTSYFRRILRSLLAKIAEEKANAI